VGTIRPEMIPEAALSELREVLGDRLTTSESDRLRHGTDESYHPPVPPDAVAYPDTTPEVVKVVTICHRHGVPMIPFGAGTSFEGHIAALRGGLSIDTSLMNQVLAVRPDDLDVSVQAGVTRQQLDVRLRRDGLFFPVDPGADASLGGMAATRASGTTTVRYGSMRDNVLGLNVVLADGRVVRTARRARKSAAGYDLTRLFVGSEGTLGVITELTLRVFGTPEAISAAVCSFPSIEQAVTCVMQTVQLDIPVARADFLDEVFMDAINRRSGLAYPLAPTLFLEFHGTDASIAEQAQQVAELARAQGAGDFEWATGLADRNRLWHARHDAFYAALAMKPGARGFPTDVCVPISRLAECITATRADLRATSLLAPILGHVGDGNFHVTFVLDPNSPEELAEAARLNARLVERALAMDGTCTGEHGVGYGKSAFLAAEHGEGLAVMRAIKAALDPQDLMNPGKIFPD
jgi:D-lactate dehydrogenase (cytochrome)